MILSNDYEFYCCFQASPCAILLVYENQGNKSTLEGLSRYMKHLTWTAFNILMKIFCLLLLDLISLGSCNINCYYILINFPTFKTNFY